MTYKQYLKTDKWKQKKQALIVRSMRNARKANRWGICESCGYTPWKPCLQVHHLTYEHLFDEPLEELLLVCPWCHQKMHSDDYTTIYRA